MQGAQVEGKGRGSGHGGAGGARGGVGGVKGALGRDPASR
ncbi:hypothetical protein SDC9_202679 [bioreactor metagenome]|uniref:Uncharacterized protein n=1 Tax=bioreactor metagenome TaxID=1076179 RepID=A0A645IVT8_9ZZZZ